MQIDWFTLGAQVFNFILLAVLLWFVLYRPVRRAVDRREEEIESRVETARQEREEAQELKEDYRRKEARLDEERDAILREAREEAETLREELQEEIRTEMEKVRQDWLDSLRQDREGFLEELSGRVREETFMVVGRALEDLVESQPRTVVRDAFLRRARDMSDEERESFGRAVSEAGNVCRLRSAMEMTQEEVAPIQELLEGWIPEEAEDGSVTVEAEVDDDGPGGIELWAGDRKLAWTVDAYVEGLRAEVERILASETGDREEDEVPAGEHPQGSGGKRDGGAPGKEDA